MSNFKKYPIIIKNTKLRITSSTPVYYINLDSSTDRNDHILGTLKRLGFKNINRISGIDTRTSEKISPYANIIDPYHLSALKKATMKGKRHFFGALTNGSVGCYLSHMKTYDEIIQNNDSNALIFEDDMIIDLPKDIFWERINKVNIPHDTDIFLLDGTYYDGVRRVEPNSNTLNIVRFTGLYSYFITNKAAELLLKYLLPIKYQIDFQISILMRANLFKVYGYDGRLDNKITKHDYQIFGTTMQNLNCKGCYMKDLDYEADLMKKRFGNSEESIEGIENFDGNRDTINYERVYCILLIVLLGAILFIWYKKGISW